MASIFSRSSFKRLLEHRDVSMLNALVEDYGIKSKKQIETYYDYLSYAYQFMVKNYRNEYVFKNTLLNEIIKRYGTSKSIVFNEFHVGNSIVDMAMFNGVSRAFEIKTELDTERRLPTQIGDYRRIFQESYVVVFEDMIDKYMTATNVEVGIVPIQLHRGRLKVMDPIRKATRKNEIEVDTLMKSLRTSEYKHIVKTYFGSLPDSINDFNAYELCESLMKTIPSPILNSLFITEMKRRKSNMKDMRSFDPYIRQMCLSMHLSHIEYDNLKEVLNQPIKL